MRPGDERQREPGHREDHLGPKAIDELHLLLGMLREHQQESLAQPGMDAVGRLVDELAQVGLPVSLDVTGSVRDVGEAMDVSAYRRVQEALTNVLKHAGGSRTLKEALA